MKFLLETLGMTNQCNLRCTYCDWEKEEYKVLRDVEYEIAKSNLEKTRKLIDKYYPEVCLVQYSGGEPFLYPPIINYVLEIFKDKWIRINTNGINIQDEQLKKIKEHGKTYLAISIDGINEKAMKPRIRGNKAILDKIIENLDRVVTAKIPVMILCTLSLDNIGFFPDFVEYIQKKYSQQINEGMLVMPTHCVTSYATKHNEVEGEIVKKFKSYIINNIKRYQLLNNISEHYEHMIYYLENKERKVPCSISDWTVSIHFRRNHLVEDGKFASFGCGMRGVRELGEFDVNKDEQVSEFIDKLSIVEQNKDSDPLRFLKEDYQEDKEIERECTTKCFPDWVMFDLIISGLVSMDKAEKWFVLFKDNKVKNFIEKYKMQLD